MKAAILEDIGKIAVRDVDDPTIGSNEILIRVQYAGVCGSDLHAFKGDHPFRKPPVILGHELAGTIVELGSQVRGFSIGDRVTVMPYLACGECVPCRRGRSNICENKVVPGIKGWRGTFAEYFVSRPEITYKLGPQMSFERGVLAEPLAVGIHSVRRGRLESGARVLVLGGGTIGLVTAIAARQSGAETVVVTDLYEYNLKVARAMGFAAYSATDARLSETILAHHPQKFDSIFLTSGAPVTVHQALSLAQRGARIVSTAIFPEPIAMSLIELTLYEMELIGTQIYTHEDFQQAMRWLGEREIPFDQLVDHIRLLSAAHEAVEDLAQRRIDAIKLVLSP